MCVCVCVCVSERREINEFDGGEKMKEKLKNLGEESFKYSVGKNILLLVAPYQSIGFLGRSPAPSSLMR